MTQQADISKSRECLLENTGQLKHDAVMMMIIILHMKHLSSFPFVGNIRALAQLTHSPSFLIGFSRRTSGRRWCIQKQILPSDKDSLVKAINAAANNDPRAEQSCSEASLEFSFTFMFSRTFWIFLPSPLCSHIPMQYGDWHRWEGKAFSNRIFRISNLFVCKGFLLQFQEKTKHTRILL